MSRRLELRRCLKFQKLILSHLKTGTDQKVEQMTKFTKTKIFCINCGKQTVLADDLDDYYAGCGLHCYSCFLTFCTSYERYMDEKEKAVVREAAERVEKLKPINRRKCIFCKSKNIWRNFIGKIWYCADCKKEFD